MNIIAFGNVGVVLHVSLDQCHLEQHTSLVFDFLSKQIPDNQSSSHQLKAAEFTGRILYFDVC